MNKKLFLGMFAAASMLLATSCTNDELDVVQSGNEAQVSFSLGLEGGIATRAISDGKSADVLMYAVFDKEGNRINTIQKVSRTGVTFPTTENITLAKGQTYKVAFWAQDEDCKAYTVSDDMKVTVNYANNENNENKVNNDETRDAFFKTVEFTATGSTSIDVELKRPFAQINVGVTQEDWDAAEASGITIAQSSVVIKNAATNLNLLDGTVSGEAEVSYELANIPADPAILEVDVDGDGTKEPYNWLSMSYILPADNTTGYAKTTLDNVAFVFAPTAGENIAFNQGLNAVPVQRNWRTNILGKLLTGDITFNIVIDEEFEDDHNVMVPYASINGVAYATFAEAMAAVQDGGTITLEGETTLDGVVDGYLFTIDGKNITIDLNGYGIVANIPDVTKNSAIFRVKKNGTLTIQGEGNVKVVTAGADNVLAALISNEGGTVNLNGGNWTMTALEYPAALIPTFVDNNSTLGASTLNINGGTYTFHRNLFRNFSNNQTEVATINIYGGTFNGRESDAGAIWNQKPSAGIPDGAGVINVMGGTFNNVVIDDEFAGVVYVETQEELVDVLANKNTHTIYLGAGTYVADIYNGTPERKSLTIIGSEGTKVAFANQQARMALFKNFKIENCEIMHMAEKSWGMLVYGGGDKADGVYTIENCTFNGVGTQGIYINENTSDATYNILNCTFDGDFGTEGAITIQANKDVNHIVNVQGCTFNNIPATSHRIYLATYDGTNFYYDWTLNTDLKAYSAYDIAMFVALGKTNIDLAAGEYIIPSSAKGKTLTIKGTGNPADVKVAVTKVGTGGENVDYGFDGSTVTFEGITITTNSSTYIGYARCKGTYKNCVINGTYTLYGDSKFENCTFNVSGDVYNIWTWGAKNMEFDRCTFNSDGKALLLYQEGTNTVNLTVNSCIFNDNGGLTSMKAAIEIGDAPYGATPTYNVAITGTTVNGYEINDEGLYTGTTLWGNKNSMPAERLNVTVDGVNVY